MDTPEVQVASSEIRQPTPIAQAPQDTQPSDTPDVDMNGAQDTVNDRNEGDKRVQPDTILPDAQPAEPMGAAKESPGLSFLDYLMSPIVELVVGQGENETILTAHQNLLRQSPFLAESIANFNETNPRRISLPDENVEAFGCFLQFQYTRNYTSPGQDAAIDDSGEQLLRHARVYTLAEKLGIPELKSLAHSKIHQIDSTSSAEIMYARYVYTHTPRDDTTIRRPVAAFWASRSHFLRHESEEEFKKLCLEVPEFCFDVLSLVLDQKEKRAQDKTEATEHGTKQSGRKRLRSGI
ncbi:hypothetical protein PHISCL_06511 [Aspergillus sclerotialis]|uniref:Uncharacterized protein n=1 Tax=Aspergillus sclerotialis TaxID=2070753 RepID=A0A3A2ZDW5_9EURO|nr:hypothetical protein PHISCL_06511 [Aspergillus sclerotialis]